MLAARSHIGLRTLQYWEKGTYSPRRVELEQVLAALEATPAEKFEAYSYLTTRRGTQMAREVAEADPELGPLPAPGDLLRGMRTRRGWTQEYLAARLGVQRETVLRWEAGSHLPNAENIESLCTVLQAYPEERYTLLRRQLSLPHWKPNPSYSDTLEQLEELKRTGIGIPLAELTLLTLKRHLRLHLNRRSEAIKPLAWLESLYASWFATQDRMDESRAAAFRALALIENEFPDDPIRFGLLNLASLQLHLGPGGAFASVRFLGRWLPRLPEHYHVIPVCDMALYSGDAGRFEEAMRLFGQAEALLQRQPGLSACHQDYYRVTYAKVLYRAGRPGDALQWLPPVPDESRASTSTLLTWAETLLRAGEPTLAVRYLNRVGERLQALPHPPPVTFRRWLSLTSSL